MSLGARASCLGQSGPLEAQSDEQLIELVRRSGKHATEERAFEVLVGRYRGALLRYCRRFSLPEARAEDVLQQALLNAWLSIRSDAEIHQLRPWLFRIVHNVALNVVRAERLRAGACAPRQTSLDAGLSARFAPAGWRVSLPRADAEIPQAPVVEDRMRAHEVLEGVADLPSSQREALLRTALGGESYSQVASALGITDGAVRGLLQRARASLRERVAALAPPPLLAWAVASGRSALLAATAGVAVTGGLVLQVEHPGSEHDAPAQQQVTFTGGSERASGPSGFTAPSATPGRGPVVFAHLAAPPDAPSRSHSRDLASRGTSSVAMTAGGAVDDLTAPSARGTAGATSTTSPTLAISDTSAAATTAISAVPSTVTRVTSATSVAATSAATATLAAPTTLAGATSATSAAATATATSAVPTTIATATSATPTTVASDTSATSAAATATSAVPTTIASAASATSAATAAAIPVPTATSAASTAETAVSHVEPLHTATAGDLVNGSLAGKSP